jgi:fumarate hydratase class II
MSAAGSSPATRLEKDSLGQVPVPSEHYWGAQTQRSLRLFPFGQAMPLAIVHALGLLKAACAEANAAMGVLDPSLADLISAVAQ